MPLSHYILLNNKFNLNMKAHRFIGFTLFAILLCLSACSSGGDDPIEPTPKPEVTNVSSTNLK